jgi:hypothetical protein
MTKNWRKITAEKIKYFFDQKLKFTYPYASVKDVQATGEASCPLKRIQHPALKNMNGAGPAEMSCTDPVIWEFPFLRGCSFTGILC